MKSKILIILILIILMNTTYAKRKAMIVGVQNYDAFAPLESCHGDVDDMRELLMQGGFEDDYIWALKDAAYGETLTASKLFSNVNAFARGINEGDEVIFFFSGHGIGGSDGNNYLMGSDGNIENPEKYGSISVEEIKKIIKEKKPAEVVLIIDACRSFVKKEDKGIGDQVSSNMNIGKGIKVQPVIQSGKTTNQEGKTIVKTIYAASEGQQSFERKDKNNGAFTYYMTYLLDSPNSAMDIDGSKDGIITIEDLILFADNRINDWTQSQGLTPMNPVYQTEGGITYEPFMLFRYNAEKVVEEQKKEGAKPIFQYDQQAELDKIKKFTENKQYLSEELPLYQPKIVKDKKIEVDNTDLSSWELALAQEQEIKKAKEEEARKEAEAKDKERIYNQLRDKYNNAVSDLDKTEDIFVKYQKLENLRNEINEVKYTEVKHKLLPLLEPIYQKIKETRDVTQAEVENLKPQFEKDIADMEKMVESSLSDDLKAKYLDGFKKKWYDYANIQKDEKLAYRYKMIFIPKVKSQVLGGLVYVESGTFQMGSTTGNSDEKPVHSVTLSDFYIGKTEVTQAQWKAVMGNNPSDFKGDNLPVESVNWFDAVECCNKLSEMEGLEKCYTIDYDKMDPNNKDNYGNDNYKFLVSCNFNANGYRLPTEAEWEYAAKGGNKSRGYTYSGSNTIDDIAWYDGNSGRKTHSVATKQPNELGIYDMSGNVWEWCWDCHGVYPSSSQTDPKGPSSGTYRVLRGGCFYNFYAEDCQVANRAYSKQDCSGNGDGFRVVRVP